MCFSKVACIKCSRLYISFTINIPESCTFQLDVACFVNPGKFTELGRFQCFCGLISAFSHLGRCHCEAITIAGKRTNRIGNTLCGFLGNIVRHSTLLHGCCCGFLGCRLFDSRFFNSCLFNRGFFSCGFLCSRSLCGCLSCGFRCGLCRCFGNQIVDIGCVVHLCTEVDLLFLYNAFFLDLEVVHSITDCIAVGCLNFLHHVLAGSHIHQIGTCTAGNKALGKIALCAILIDIEDADGRTGQEALAVLSKLIDFNLIMGSHAEDGSGAVIRSVTELRTAVKILGDQRTGEVTTLVFIHAAGISAVGKHCPFIGYIGIGCQNGTLEVVADNQLTAFGHIIEIVQKACYAGMVVLTLVRIGSVFSGNPGFHIILIDDLCEFLAVVGIGIGKMNHFTIAAGIDIHNDVGIFPCTGRTIVVHNRTRLFELGNIAVLNISTLYKILPLGICQTEVDAFSHFFRSGVGENSNVCLLGSIVNHFEFAICGLTAQLQAVGFQHDKLIFDAEVIGLEELVLVAVVVSAVLEVLRSIGEIHTAADPENLTVVRVQLLNGTLIDDQVGKTGVIQKNLELCVLIALVQLDEVTLADFIVPTHVVGEVCTAAHGHTALGVGVMRFEIFFQENAELGCNTQCICIVCIVKGACEIVSAQAAVFADKQRYVIS